MHAPVAQEISIAKSGADTYLLLHGYTLRQAAPSLTDGAPACLYLANKWKQNSDTQHAHACLSANLSTEVIGVCSTRLRRPSQAIYVGGSSGVAASLHAPYSSTIVLSGAAKQPFHSLHDHQRFSLGVY